MFCSKFSILESHDFKFEESSLNTLNPISSFSIPFLALFSDTILSPALLIRSFPIYLGALVLHLNKL